MDLGAVLELQLTDVVATENQIVNVGWYDMKSIFASFKT